jgi:predicted GNAT superfamily acetyltransferase
MPNGELRGPRAALLDRAIAVRRVHTVDEYRQCERLQDQVWGPGDVAGVPLLDLLTAQENGGMVLGAFTDEGTLVGFVYSFLGLDGNRRIKHCSVILGVAPEHRGHGIGLRLKRAQRDEALAQGLDLITWTFDPLLAVNANLNVRRLGAVARDYRVNHYAAAHGLNGGLDTDRLIVEWWLRRQRRTDPAPLLETAVPIARTCPDPITGLPTIAEVDLDLDAPALLLPIPPDLDAIKRRDLAQARHWRLQTRVLFETYFDRGYWVAGFQPGAGPAARTGYLLAREPLW